MIDDYKEKHSVPDIELAGLRIWVDGRQYPKHYDFWDGNWLKTTVHCNSEQAFVWFGGDFLRNTDIAEWLDSLVKLNEALLDEANSSLEVIPGEANFNPITRGFYVKIKAETYRRISVRVQIGEDNRSERHYFEFWLEEDRVKGLIESCRKILNKFPIRGKIPESTKT